MSTRSTQLDWETDTPPDYTKTDQTSNWLSGFDKSGRVKLLTKQTFSSGREDGLGSYFMETVIPPATKRPGMMALLDLSDITLGTAKFDDGREGQPGPLATSRLTTEHQPAIERCLRARSSK